MWQPAPVLYPDAELVLTTAMRAALVTRAEADVFVSRSVPNPRKARMVILTRDGGTPSGVIDTARIRIRCYDQTHQAATDLARLVLALAPTLVGSNGITAVRFQSGPYEVADEQPMRYALAEFDLRGEAL